MNSKWTPKTYKIGLDSYPIITYKNHMKDKNNEQQKKEGEKYGY